MIDIVMLMVCCVLANHLGLIEAVEKFIEHKIPILNCIKCSTFWICLLYSLFLGGGIIVSVMISFALAYAAIWLELVFGLIDVAYEKAYKRIYKDSETANKENTDYADTEDSESALP